MPADDVVIVPLQLTFIFGIWVSLLALVSGARIILRAALARGGGPERLARRRNRAGGRPIHASDADVGCRARGTPGIAHDFPPAASSWATALLWSRSGKAWPGAGMFDLYGLTETGSCDFCLTPSGPGAGHRHDRLSDPGVSRSGWRRRTAQRWLAGRSGELQIRTPFGMLGYLDQSGPDGRGVQSTVSSDIGRLGAGTRRRAGGDRRTHQGDRLAAATNRADGDREPVRQPSRCHRRPVHGRPG